MKNVANDKTTTHIHPQNFSNELQILNIKLFLPFQ